MARHVPLPLSCIIAAFAALAIGHEMDGEWVSVSRVGRGEQTFAAPMHAVIKDGRLSTLRDGTLEEAGTITENTSSTPPQYDLTMTGDVDLSGNTFRGIFTISGDTMVTCVHALPGGARPTAFTSTKENAQVLVVWMRKDALEKLEALERDATR